MLVRMNRMGKENKGMNRKGLALVGGHFVKILLAIVGLLIIGFLLFKFYEGATIDNELKIAKGDIVNIAVGIDAFKASNLVEDSLISLSPVGWYLKGYPSEGIIHPEGECLAKESCLCVCREADCRSSLTCNGFDYIVEVDEFEYVNEDYEDIDIIVDYGDLDRIKNVMKFENSGINLKLIKEGDVIKIRK